MDGEDFLNEVKKRIEKRNGHKLLTDTALAKELGITSPALKTYRRRGITAHQAANLMEKYAKSCERFVIGNVVVPIVEFFFLDPVETKQGQSQRLFSTGKGNAAHPYLSGLQDRLKNAHGIYIFHDSRGRAIYAGKAQRLSLWNEMNNAFNRERGEVQNIKRVAHPTNRVEYREEKEGDRKIQKEAVSLHHIASYVSAYEVPDALIGKFEALIIRAFANDLLNARMESF